ncbi:hypothetical protein IKF86_00325 [Candidatus Saccharibacteria bacterium]|nr:hypothetical protein [Candidatus Saccharibacteria bacterium]
MDPINQPTPNPTPAAPTSPEMPNVPMGTATSEPVNVAPEANVPPMNAAPETSTPPMGAAPETNVPPVNPAAAGTPDVTAVPEAPVVAPGAPVVPTPVNPVFQPNGGGLVGATTPITMPEQPKAPDPIEEELKAPLKAAAPAPGSIGSAVSGPEAKTPNVSFDDPAMANAMQATAPNAKPAKKKTDKKTLIILCAIIGVIVVALAAVLIMQLTGVL